MKYIITSAFIFLYTFYASGQSHSKSAKANTGIHWMSIEDVQEQMKIMPKKVYIDIYSENDGWCKVMQTKTFTNKKVIDYINDSFYAIHLDAETQDSLYFQGKKYGRIEGRKTNELAAKFMKNKISFPYSVFFDEKFSNPQPVPGYLDVSTFEMILTYIATNKYKKVPFDKYKNEFKGTW